MALASCAGTREYVLQGSNLAAGADGELRVEELDGGNFSMNLAVSNLLPLNFAQVEKLFLVFLETFLGQECSCHNFVLRTEFASL